MRRAQSASSEPEEGNDAILQEELEKLQNDLRIHLNDKSKYEEEVKVKMKKLNEERDHLEAENKDLKIYLNQAESDQNKKVDDKNLRKLKDLINEYDKNCKLIEDEKQKINSLDIEVKKYEKLTKNNLKRKENSSASTKDGEVTEVQRMVDRKILGLENRMDKQIKKYNTTLTENGVLRDLIEKLRNERVIYNDVYKRLAQELQNLRLEKEDLTERATLAYDQRDEANNKCIALKDKNDKDRAQHDTEMRDLQRIVDHDHVLREFMTTKSDDRREWKKIGEERRRKHGSSGEIAQKQQRKQIHTYEQAFKRIKEITSKEDINILVEDFIRNEDDNFAMFQYVSELNNQIESLNEDMYNIQNDIDKFQREEEHLEVERHRILKELELQYTSKKEEADRAQIRLVEINKILEQLREGVKSVFTKINCDDSVILDILGGDSDVTDRNLMLYLGSIEQRTNAMLGVAYYVQTKQYYDNVREEQPEHGMTLGLTGFLKPSKDSLVNAPGISDDFNLDSDDSQDDVRPLSQHELYIKAMKDMKKRDHQSYSKASRSIVEMKKRKN